MKVEEKFNLLHDLMIAIQTTNKEVQIEIWNRLFRGLLSEKRQSELIGELHGLGYL